MSTDSCCPRVSVRRKIFVRNFQYRNSRRIPNDIRRWVLKKVTESVLPILTEIDNLRMEFLFVKKTYLNDNFTSKKPSPPPGLYFSQDLGSARYNHSLEISHTPDISDEVDKTGFSQLKARALLKAAKCSQNLSPGMTLGPDAAPNIWTPSPCGEACGRTNEDADLGCSVDLDITPIPQAHPSRRKPLRAVRLITEEPTEETSMGKEIFYQKRILADLNQLSLQGAQANMRLYLKKWEEHDEKVQELLAQRKAQQQANDLARQQAKILEMTKMQEEYIKKQQELDANQAKRDLEFYRRHEENKKQQLEVERLHREKLKKQADLVQCIFDCFASFSSKYREILELFQKHEELKNSVACDLEVMKSCHEKFNSLIAKCKLDQISDEDVQTAQHLLNDVTAFNLNVRREVARIELIKTKERELQGNMKRIEEDKIRKKKEDEDRRQLQDNNPVLPQSMTADVDSMSDDITQSKRYKQYLQIKKYHEIVESKLQELVENESLKKFRRDCEKAVNIPLNTISAAGASHLLDKYKRLSGFLQGQTVVISEKRFSATSHPLGCLYSMDYLALKTVKQGEQCVSSNPEAAYPIAAVVIATWMDIPDYGQLLLAHFYRASPYLIPAYFTHNESESDEEYYKRLGFKYINGEQEEMDKFLKRQSGIIRLYCAIIVTAKNKANRRKPHPLPLADAWEWVTSFIVLPPKADISATLLLEMLEITGHMMMSTFSGQFRKLLHLICISYLPLVEKVTPSGRGGPVTRLRLFLEGLISGKTIPPPKGLLSPNFW